MNTTIRYTTFLLLSTLIFSCGDKNSNQKETSIDNTKKAAQQELANKPNEPKTTFLCKINGKDWGYTKASGIVVNNKQKGTKEIHLTFTKKLEKGKEHIGLQYDYLSGNLIAADFQLKFPKKDGDRLHAIYTFFPDTMDQHPESNISGKVEIGESTASGDAQVTNLPIRWGKNLLANPADDTITVTELGFDNIGYSDVAKAMKNLMNK